MKTADLHIHTLASDGSLSAEEVLKYARKVNLSAISITDHDSVQALPEAMVLSSKYGIEIIPGVEISVEMDGAEVHLLGYCLDYQNEEFLSRLELLRQERLHRAEKMVRKLKEIGLPLNPDNFLPAQTPGAVGRLHIARALYQAGHVNNTGEAFQKYIGRDGPAYVPKLKLTVEEAMDMIVGLGGVPVLAHPGQLNRDNLIPGLMAAGLAGLEVYYPSHSQWQVNHFLEMARHFRLLVTGGSDCHGLNKGKILMGTVRIPYDLVERLKKKADNNC